MTATAQTEALPPRRRRPTVFRARLGVLEADARYARRRLRRHRHKPTLRVEGVPLRRCGWRRAHPRDGLRHRVADPVGADRHRDGQVRALHPARRQQRRGRHADADGARPARHGPQCLVVILLGMAGAALFYGDAIITPAISVLSAVEGLTLVTPAFERYVLPLSLVILIGLFAVQSHGTARVAAWFGPITAVWFVLMALGGLHHIADEPEHPGRRSARPTGCRFSSIMGRPVCSPSGRCSWPSRAPRRSTPTWAISADARSRPPGSGWSCRRSP